MKSNNAINTVLAFPHSDALPRIGYFGVKCNERNL